MYNFILASQPKSYNARKSDAYQSRIKAAFQTAYPVHHLINHDLYGLVYHFYKVDIGIDADNISKLVWDSLTGVAFVDDSRVKLRMAGSFDLSSTDLVMLDFSGLTKETIDSLLEAIESEDHVLYIECGEFSMNLIRLNLESDGN